MLGALRKSLSYAADVAGREELVTILATNSLVPTYPSGPCGGIEPLHLLRVATPNPCARQTRFGLSASSVKRAPASTYPARTCR